MPTEVLLILGGMLSRLNITERDFLIIQKLLSVKYWIILLYT